MRCFSMSAAAAAAAVFCFAANPAPRALADPTSAPDATLLSTYHIEDLGELPHIADDMLAPINRDGQVAFWVQNGQNVHAAVWRNDSPIDLGAQSGYPNSIAHAINAHGDIGGWMNTSNNPVDSLSTVHGFIRSGKHVKMLGTLGGRDGRVLALDDNGLAVGDADLKAGGRHAFLAKGSSITDLGTLPTGTYSSAYCISNTDIIAGVADIDGKHKHAVCWKNGKIADLGALPGGTDSSARSVNDKGQIVGYSETPTGYHAFLYTDGAMQDLGTLGSDPSMASGINNAGDVVGSSALSGFGHHAFLWRNGQLIDLNTRTPKDSGWILTSAYSINDKGQIVCTGFRKGQSTHLILLTP